MVWGCADLTLGEAVVFYHDWALDQGGPDGSYISHESLSARLGGKLTPATVSKVRQRLKRLTLHEPLRRANANSLGWVSTLPRACMPRTYHEIPALAVALGAHLRTLTVWSNPNGLQGTGELDPRVQAGQTLESTRAAALGGRGVSSASPSVPQGQLPSALKEKGIGAYAPKLRRQKEAPLTREEMDAFRAGVDRDVRDGKLTIEQGDLMKRVSGL